MAAGLVAVALTSAVLLRHPSPGSGSGAVNLETQFDYVAVLAGEDVDDDEGEGLETDIENYFL